MASAQNTLIAVPDGIMKPANIKLQHVKALVECSRVTGWTFSRLLNEALSNYIEDVVPVLMESAGRCRKQPV